MTDEQGKAIQSQAPPFRVEVLKNDDEPIEAGMSRRWKIGLLVGAGVLTGLLLLIGTNLISYERAGICDGDSSRGCITRSSGVISELGREWTQTGCGGPGGCVSQDFYALTVVVAETSEPVELAFDGHRLSDLEVGDDVVLESWRGRYVTLTDQGRTINVAGWEPELVMLAITVGLVLAVVVIVLRRADLLISINGDFPSGVADRLRWSLGLTLSVAGSCVIMMLILGLIGDQTLLYLRWW